jgi:hypothetical protein
MGSVKYRETSIVGEARSIIEYEFTDASDYFAFDEYRNERLTSALKSFVGGLGYPEESEPMVADVQVGPKTKKETKH